jgi:hypothetical protein
MQDGSDKPHSGCFEPVNICYVWFIRVIKVLEVVVRISVSMVHPILGISYRGIRCRYSTFNNQLPLR